MNKESFSEKERQALDFLGRDFNQCFQQMRHYDSQIVNIFKFMFVAYTGLIGIALGLFEINNNLLIPAGLVLFLAFVLGIIFFALVIRNRVYFVQVTRYINEQRELFFKLEPMGFKNKSRMYTDPTNPPFFNKRSSQAWFTYIIAFMNAVCFGAFFFIVSAPLSAWPRILFVIISALAALTVQLAVGIAYLKTREGKSAEKAVFGKEKQE